MKKDYTITGCTKHPKYKAIRKPKVRCKACWAFYRQRNEK